MGESKLKMIRLTREDIYNIAEDLDLSIEYNRILRINIELDLINMTGNIIIIPRDETHNRGPINK